jgi:hypothetical protein
VTEKQCATEAIGRFNVAAIMVFERTTKNDFMNTVDLAMKAQTLINKSKNNTAQIVHALLTLARIIGLHVTA